MRQLCYPAEAAEVVLVLERLSEISSSFWVGVGGTGAEGRSLNVIKVPDRAKLAPCLSRTGQSKLQTAPSATRVRPETFGTLDGSVDRSFQAQQTQRFPNIPPYSRKCSEEALLPLEPAPAAALGDISHLLKSQRWRGGEKCDAVCLTTL